MKVDSQFSLGQSISDWMDLTKARLCLLALMMAMLGYNLAGPLHAQGGNVIAMLIGLSLIGAACGILNQYLESDLDALMERTMDRALPQGRVSPMTALKVGIAAAFLGEAVLLFAVNSITAVLGAFTIYFYLGIYTPAKRVSSLSTLIGTIPGAMPALMGWTSASGKIGLPGFLLFMIIVVWQVPHFLSIAWLYREDYGRAGLPILSVVDPEGKRMARMVKLYALVLIPLSLVPTVWNMTGNVYFLGTLVIGGIFLLGSFELSSRKTLTAARRLFVISILYLPILGFLMVWDKL